MREHETSAPSLGDWVMVPIFPTEAMMDAGADECRRNAGVLDPVVHIWDAMLAAAAPSTMAEAVASARAEGVKDGLERAATACRKVRGGGYSATPSDCVRAVQNELDAIASWRPSLAPPTLIPGGSSDV